MSLENTIITIENQTNLNKSMNSDRKNEITEAKMFEESRSEETLIHGNTSSNSFRNNLGSAGHSSNKLNEVRDSTDSEA